MIYSFCVQAAPHIHQGNQTALAMAQAVVSAGHQIKRVFFYLDGVHSASSLILPHQNEPSLLDGWLALKQDHGVELVVCVAAALRRGLTNDFEARANDLPATNIHPEFEVGGLGLWVEAAIESDRMLTFK